MHYMCKCVFVFAPLLLALSLSHALSLPLSFSFIPLLAVSFLQLLQLHKLDREEGERKAKRTSHIFSR